MRSPRSCRSGSATSSGWRRSSRGAPRRPPTCTPASTRITNRDWPNVLDELGGRSAELRQVVDDLTERVTALQAEENAHRDQRAEAELRAAVGEYSPDQWREVSQGTEADIARVAARRAEAASELAQVQQLLNMATATVRRPDAGHVRDVGGDRAVTTGKSAAADAGQARPAPVSGDRGDAPSVRRTRVPPFGRRAQRCPRRCGRPERGTVRGSAAAPRVGADAARQDAGTGARRRSGGRDRCTVTGCRLGRTGVSDAGGRRWPGGHRDRRRRAAARADRSGGGAALPPRRAVGADQDAQVRGVREHELSHRVVLRTLRGRARGHVRWRRGRPTSGDKGQRVCAAPRLCHAASCRCRLLQRPSRADSCGGPPSSCE